MNHLETLQARFAEIRATLQANEQSAQELRDGVQYANAESTHARAHLAALLAQGKAAPPTALGEQMMLVQELEDTAATVARDAEPALAKLDTEAAALRSKSLEVQDKMERAVLGDLVGQYEAVLLPAWGLADKIRAQAVRCRVRLEVEGPLLDRQRCLVAGYPLKVGPA